MPIATRALPAVVITAAPSLPTTSVRAVVSVPRWDAWDGTPSRRTSPSFGAWTPVHSSTPSSSCSHARAIWCATISAGWHLHCCHQHWYRTRGYRAYCTASGTWLIYHKKYHLVFSCCKGNTTFSNFSILCRKNYKIYCSVRGPKIKSRGKIREPQWKNITFALSTKRNDGAPSTAGNIFQAWGNFLAAQRVKIGRSESAKLKIKH